MESLIQMMLGFAIVLLAILIVVYVIQGIILSKLNKEIYGKGTPMAWIPIVNIYLLGKLTINKLVGWILIGCVFLTTTYTTTVNGIEETYTILPENISSLVSTLYSIVVIVLYIYAIIKYNKLKREKGNQILEISKQEKKIITDDSEVNKFCSNCGFKLARNAKFCMRCGKHF